MRYRLTLLTAVAALAASGLARQTVRLWPEADAFVTSDLPDRNTGGWTYLAVTRWPSMPQPWYEETLLRFDLGSIPPGSPVEQATLRLVCWDRVGAADCWCSPATSAWAESSVTWNSRPGFDTASQARFTVTSHPCTLRIDVRGLVQAWVDGRPNFGFCVRPADTDSEYVVQFRSRETPDTTADPELTVTYSLTALESGRELAPPGHGLRLMPNPASARARPTVTLSGNLGAAPVSIFASSGRLLLTITPCAGTVRLPGTLSPGAYVARYGPATAKLLILP